MYFFFIFQLPAREKRRSDRVETEDKAEASERARARARERERERGIPDDEDE
jgi:hypothetical protein